MAEANIYGVDLAMGPLGDLVVSSAGDLAVLGDVQVMAQALQLRLRTVLGDLTLHPDYGTVMPVGQKMDAVAVAMALNGELAQTVTDDPRIRSATVTAVQWPASGDLSAVSLGVLCVLAGGTQFEATGLPAEVRVGEISESGNVEGESGLSAFEEQPYFADEETTVQIEGESELESLVNDLTGE